VKLKGKEHGIGLTFSTRGAEFHFMALLSESAIWGQPTCTFTKLSYLPSQDFLRNPVRAE